MEISWALLAFVSLTTITFFFKFITNNQQPRQRKFPPGPKPWPIIGNLNLLGPDPHQSLHVLSQKYGEIMQLKFGSCPVIIASSPEMAKQFLKTHDSVFASRPSTAAGKYTNYNSSDVLWSPYGPYFRQARKIYLNNIFNSKTLESYEHIRVEERNLFMSRLNSLSGKPVVLRDHMSRFTLSSISRMVLGDKYMMESESHESEDSIINLVQYRDMIDQWFLLNGAFNIGDWIPWLSFLDLQGYVKEMKNVFKKMDRILNYVVDDHIATRNVDQKNGVSKDMVDILLQLAEDPNLEVKLTKDHVKALIQDLLAGGTDTSATTVEWAMHELLKQPHIIEKATKELDRVIGKSRWVEENDFSDLPYLHAIIKETFRLHSITTLLPPHYAMDDCNVAGYDICKGTTILINQWSLGRNEKYWGDTFEEFLPERFMDKHVDIMGQNFALLPFGSGRRMCPGYSLGLKLVFTTLANLLHGFNWKLPEGMLPKDVCMQEQYGLTSRPKTPIATIMEPRLPDHLYNPLP